MQFERMLIAGLQRRLCSTFSLPAEPALISSTDRWRLAQRLQPNDGKESSLKLPLAYLRLTTLELKEDGYNLQALVNKGLYGERKTNDTVVSRYLLLPAVFTFEFTQLTQDFFDMLSFSRHVLMSVRDRSKLSFKVNYDGIQLDVRVRLATSVSTPEKDVAIDVAGLYETTVEVQVDGFVSHDLEDAETVPVVTHVNGVLRDWPGNELGTLDAKSDS